MNIKKILVGSAASAMMLTNMALPALASHNGAVVDVNTPDACSETTFSATIADSEGTHKVANMRLIVDDGNSVQVSDVIPTDGSSVEINVGPFVTDTSVSWRVFGGGERDYDNPSWNGYGDATFNTDVTDYGNNNTFDFVIAGTDDPNPFTTWNTVDIDKCIARNAEITAPTPGEEVSGMVDFEAFLVDDDADSVQWAVRQGTCAAGTNTVFGNVDGHSDIATIDQSNVENQTFSFTGNMSGMTPGSYCFIYNPVEDGGEKDIRLTREFTLEEPVVGPPTHKNQCKNEGWKDFNNPSFKNQGQCVSYVVSQGKSPNKVTINLNNKSKVNTNVSVFSNTGGNKIKNSIGGNQNIRTGNATATSNVVTRTNTNNINIR